MFFCFCLGSYTRGRSLLVISAARVISQNSKHVASQRWQPERCGADMADALSVFTGSAVVPLTPPLALRANGRASNTTAFAGSTVCPASQWQRRGTAIAKSLDHGSLTHRADTRGQHRGHAGPTVVPLCRPSITTFVRSADGLAVMR